MGIEQLFSVRRDKFELEVQSMGLQFPCCVCIHRHGPDIVEPCRTCDHNANAVDEDTRQP